MGRRVALDVWSVPLREDARKTLPQVLPAAPVLAVDSLSYLLAQGLDDAGRGLHGLSQHFQT